MLALLDDLLLDVAAGRIDRLIFNCAPQEGKSQRLSRTFPLWLLMRNPDARIAIASYEASIARRWGRFIRNDISSNPQFGLKVRRDTSAAQEWQLENHIGGIVTVGVGGALVGRPVGGDMVEGPDGPTVGGVMVIDDPLKGRAEADSKVFRERCIEWWQESASTRLAPGTPVVLLMTRWHEGDLAGWLAENDPRWRVVNVPTLADHDPLKGEVDPLGREPGEYLISARGRSPQEWELIRKQVGSRGWAAQYQGSPAPAEGTLFKRGDWQYYNATVVRNESDGTMRAPSMDEVIQSWDCTFKDTKSSDYVVGQVWGRIGADVFLLDQVRDRMDFPATCRALEALSAKWPQAHRKIVEDKANGPAVISQLRTRVAGLIPISPKDSKYARASAVAPFVESHNVHLPDPVKSPWVNDFTEELAGFPNSAHDDQVDAMSQAISRLLGDQGSAEHAMDWLRGFAAK